MKWYNGNFVWLQILLYTLKNTNIHIISASSARSRVGVGKVVMSCPGLNTRERRDATDVANSTLWLCKGLVAVAKEVAAPWP